jgi:hypothetical protein
MKTRIFFYCAATVALVLFLAAIPSRATERRDPFVIQDATQTPPAKSSGTTHAAPSRKKTAPKNTQRQKGASANAEKKNSTDSSQNASSAHEGAGTSSAAK